MNCDILNRKEDLDHCVEVHEDIYNFGHFVSMWRGEYILYNILGQFGNWDTCGKASQIIS